MYLSRLHSLSNFLIVYVGISLGEQILELVALLGGTNEVIYYADSQYAIYLLNEYLSIVYSGYDPNLLNGRWLPSHRTDATR